MLMVGSGIRPTVTRPTYGNYEALIVHQVGLLSPLKE